MDEPGLDKIMQRLLRRSDRELKAIVTMEADDYRPDVVEAVRAELSRRGVELPASPDAFVAELDSDELHDSPYFCQACMRASTDEPFPATGETLMRRLMPGRGQCPDCGAIKRAHYVSYMGLRLFYLDSYLVKQAPRTGFIVASRKLAE